MSENKLLHSCPDTSRAAFMSMMYMRIMWCGPRQPWQHLQTMRGLQAVTSHLCEVKALQAMTCSNAQIKPLPTPRHTLAPPPPKNYEGGIPFATLSVFHRADVSTWPHVDEHGEMEDSTI